MDLLALREALKFSPDNTALRLLLANALYDASQWDEAEQEFKTVIRQNNDAKARKGLALLYLSRKNFSACNVILEGILEDGTNDPDVYIMHAKALIGENAIPKAIDAYAHALELGGSDEQLDAQLRMPQMTVDAEEEEWTDSRFLEKPDVDFSKVGGMESVKKEIELKIIRPLMHPELYKAYGKKAGGGILLYGPPGCGKTFIAKATAGEVKAKFISVTLNDILDMWIGNSEKNLHEVFELARANGPCVLFIDEIDALGASRSDMKHSSSRHLINQFLQELDGVDSSNEGVLVIGATNSPWSLDPAFRRPGRFDRIIFVPPPDAPSREKILALKLQDKPVGQVDVHTIAAKMEHYSGADIDAVIDIAIEHKLEEAFTDGIPKPIENKDLLQAMKKHKPSTQEWFGTARNFAMFANDSGLYDDILTYMKIRK